MRFRPLLFLALVGACVGQEATPLEPLIEGRCGNADGDGKLASLMLRQPGALLATEDGVIVCDLANSKIRKIRIAAGTSEVLVDQTNVDMPAGITHGADGSFFFTDLGNQQVKRLSGSSVSVVAGHKVPQEAAPTQDQGVMASMRAPYGIAADGLSMDLYVSDVLDNKIRKITRLTGIVEFFAGSGQAAFQDGEHSTAAFHHPMGVAIEGRSLYVADSKNHAVRIVKISDGSVTTLVGTGERGSTDGGKADARLDAPVSILVKDEMVFVADSDGRRIRRFSTATGKLTTLHQFELATPSGLALVPGQSPTQLILFVSDSTKCGLHRLSLVPGCDGKVLSAATVDRCGVCGGTDECLDCKGVPHGLAVKDRCGVCGGDGSGCRPSPRETIGMPLDGTFVKEAEDVPNGAPGANSGGDYITKNFEQAPPLQSSSVPVQPAPASGAGQGLQSSEASKHQNEEQIQVEGNKEEAHEEGEDEGAQGKGNKEESQEEGYGDDAQPVGDDGDAQGEGTQRIPDESMARKEALGVEQGKNEQGPLEGDVGGEAPAADVVPEIQETSQAPLRAPTSQDDKGASTLPEVVEGTSALIEDEDSGDESPSPNQGGGEEDDKAKGWLGGWFDDGGSGGEGSGDDSLDFDGEDEEDGGVAGWLGNWFDDGGSGSEDALDTHDKNLLAEAMREKEMEERGEKDVAGRIIAAQKALQPREEEGLLLDEEDSEGGSEEGDDEEEEDAERGRNATLGQNTQQDGRAHRADDGDDSDEDSEGSMRISSGDKSMFGSKWWMIVLVLLFVIASFKVGFWCKKNAHFFGQASVRRRAGTSYEMLPQAA